MQKNNKFARIVAELKRSATAGAALGMIYLPRGWPERDQPLPWAVRDTQGRVQHGIAANLGAVPPALRATRLCVWTPGSETSLMSVMLPTRARAKILQALPYALEEQILGEPETMHFAYRVLGEGQLAVAVTAKERIDAWHAALQSADLRPAAAAPINLALPLTENTWSAAFIDEGLSVRTGGDSGFDCALADRALPPLLSTAIREARAKDRAPQGLRLFNAPADFDLGAWSTALEVPVEIVDGDLWRYVDTLPSLSLFQAGGGAGGARLNPLARKLRPAAIMLAVWIVAGFVFDTFEWWQLSHAATAQRSEMTALFRRAFPEAKTVVDPALQMQRNLADLQARGGSANPGDFLPLLQQLTPLLQANGALQLQSLQYDGNLTLEIHAPDFQALDGIKNALVGKGLQAEILTSNSKGSAVDGKLRISARKS